MLGLVKSVSCLVEHSTCGPIVGLACNIPLPYFIKGKEGAPLELV
jgi:hypothetical protein